jgi:hypothetical protein
MLDSVRTLQARFTARVVTRPRALVTTASLWLAADADGTEEKRRCLEPLLDPAPENEPATLALLVLDPKRPDS